jgi:16S rRNA (guanine527-N7)-methyltransferase
VTYDVSRETCARLDTFCELVRKWNPKVNLVSRASLPELWERHVADSVQLLKIQVDMSHWVDIGSGGGFPGVVIAAAMPDRSPNAKMTLVESDQRKAAFLRTAIRELGLPATVKSQRIEDCDPMEATVISARALAPLSQLLGYAHRHLVSEGIAVFPKGATWQKEVADACQEWSFSHEAIKSQTDPDAAILVIRDIKKS